MSLRKDLENVSIHPETILDDDLRTNVVRLKNAVESFAKENDDLRTENQALKDEINLLKGEHANPKFSKKKREKNSNHSSEEERKSQEKNAHQEEEEDSDTEEGKQKKRRKKRSKKGRVTVDRTEHIVLDRTGLPDDLQFKGYQKTVIQELAIVRDNICFEREIYYSPSMKKTYTAPLPKGYTGQFGPNIKTTTLHMYQDGGMTEPGIKRFLDTHGIHISSGTISDIITNQVDVFHEEKIQIIDAGLQSTTYQHLDDTYSPVNGKNQHTHILCNPFYTAYLTLPRRDRLAAIRVLSNRPLIFSLNEDTYALMEKLKLPKKRIEEVRALSKKDMQLDEAQMDAFLAQLYPDVHRYQTNQKRIREAAAIVAYKQSTNKIEILMSDGGKQFETITEHHALCWVHEGRHYKKLNPLLLCHRQTVENFIQEFWDFYRRLLAYKSSPKRETADKLSKDFDTVFSKKTGYEALDTRIASTLAHKEKLLLVLTYPEIPLHNNPAESGARMQARKRDISLQTKSEKGTQAKDTMMTIVETAKKLGVNTFNYILDRISQSYKMDSLASLIAKHATLANDTS